MSLIVGVGTWIIQNRINCVLYTVWDSEPSLRQQNAAKERSLAFFSFVFSIRYLARRGPRKEDTRHLGKTWKYEKWGCHREDNHCRRVTKYVIMFYFVEPIYCPCRGFTRLVALSPPSAPHDHEHTPPWPARGSDGGK